MTNPADGDLPPIPPEYRSIRTMDGLVQVGESAASKIARIERECRIGPVEKSVKADLERLGRLDEGVRGSLAQMALRLARAYDLCADADLAQLARANMELRQTLSRIAEVDDDGDPGEAARMSTPVRDAADAGTADVGAAHDGGGAPAG